MYFWRVEVDADADNVTRNLRCHAFQSLKFSRFSHWSWPSRFALPVWWVSQLLCHTQSAFLMTEPQTSRDKMASARSQWQRQVTQLQFRKGWRRAGLGVWPRDGTFRAEVRTRTCDAGRGVEVIDLVTSNAVPAAPAEPWGVRWNTLILAASDLRANARDFCLLVWCTLISVSQTVLISYLRVIPGEQLILNNSLFCPQIIWKQASELSTLNRTPWITAHSLMWITPHRRLIQRHGRS